MSAPVVVAARIRPALPHEAAEPVHVTADTRPTKPSVTVLGGNGDMRGTAPCNLSLLENRVTFEFDHVFAELDPAGASRGQELVHKALGTTLIQSALDPNGTGGTLLAYGESGSGKSHSILGYGRDAGLIPSICFDLFALMATGLAHGLPAMNVWCSYYEVWQDHVRDLLRSDAPGERPPDLELCELPSGVVVPLLTESVVSSIDDVQHLVDYGNKMRVAKARQLRASPQSHVIFTLRLEQPDAACRSSISLVDCASSVQYQLEPSLAALQKVVAALSRSQAATGKSENCKVDNSGATMCKVSKFTNLLRESLVGSAQLIVLATVSPTRNSACETVSTLEFASSVRKMQRRSCQAAANSVKQFQIEVNAELKELQKRLSVAHSADPGLRGIPKHLLARRGDLERFVEQSQVPYEVQRQNAARLREAHLSVLRAYGIANHVPVELTAISPAYLLNVSADPLLNGSLVYLLKTNTVSTVGSDPSNDVVVSGLGVAAFHCSLRHLPGICELWCHEKENRALVNGKLVWQEPCPLFHASHIVLGWSHVFQTIIYTTNAKHPKHSVQTLSYGSEPSLDDCLAEVALHSSSPVYAAAENALKAICFRLGIDLPGAMINKLRSWCPFVEEANALIQEMHTRSDLQLEVVPCCGGVDSNESLHAKGHVDLAELIGIRTVLQTETRERELGNLWTPAKFAEHLHMLRGIYEEWYSGNVEQDTVQTWIDELLLDPWHDLCIPAYSRRSGQDMERLAGVGSRANPGLRLVNGFASFPSDKSWNYVEMGLGTDNKRRRDRHCDRAVRDDAREQGLLDAARTGTKQEKEDNMRSQRTQAASLSLQNLMFDQHALNVNVGHQLREELFMELKAENAALRQELARIEQRHKLIDSSIEEPPSCADINPGVDDKDQPKSSTAAVPAWPDDVLNCVDSSNSRASPPLEPHASTAGTTAHGPQAGAHAVVPEGTASTKTATPIPSFRDVSLLDTPDQFAHSPISAATPSSATSLLGSRRLIPSAPSSSIVMKVDLTASPDRGFILKPDTAATPASYFGTEYANAGINRTGLRKPVEVLRARSSSPGLPELAGQVVTSKPAVTVIRQVSGPQRQQKAEATTPATVVTSASSSLANSIAAPSGTVRARSRSREVLLRNSPRHGERTTSCLDTPSRQSSSPSMKYYDNCPTPTLSSSIRTIDGRIRRSLSSSLRSLTGPPRRALNSSVHSLVGQGCSLNSAARCDSPSPRGSCSASYPVQPTSVTSHPPVLKSVTMYPAVSSPTATPRIVKDVRDRSDSCSRFQRVLSRSPSHTPSRASSRAPSRRAPVVRQRSLSRTTSVTTQPIGWPRWPQSSSVQANDSKYCERAR